MFKKGDRVLCINGSSDDLLQGEVYTILQPLNTEPKKVTVEENPRYNWFETRFILVTPLIEALF